ncbi:MAG: ankyrin repeat domain-containing protein [Spirochaetia bacterium]|nr:ankyrin repeat domain-containing protein [Spirochaetia bacterium]
MFDYKEVRKAVMTDNEAYFRVLLKDAGDINEPDMYGFPLLAYASEGGSVVIVKMLLEAGAKPERLFRRHHNCLTITALAGIRNRAQVLKLLLDAGAPVDLRGYNDNTALIEAAFSGRVDCMKLLIERGADLNAQNVKATRP